MHNRTTANAGDTLIACGQNYNPSGDQAATSPAVAPGDSLGERTAHFMCSEGRLTIKDAVDLPIVLDGDDEDEEDDDNNGNSEDRHRPDPYSFSTIRAP